MSDELLSTHVPKPPVLSLPERLSVVWTLQRLDTGRQLTCGLYRSSWGSDYVEVRVSYSDYDVEITQLLPTQEEAREWAEGYRTAFMNSGAFVTIDDRGGA